MEKRGPLTYQRIIYGYECDIYGHLNNANYLHLYEAARSEALNSIGLPQGKLFAEGVELILNELSLRFIRPVVLDQPVTVESVIVDTTKVRFFWKQRILSQHGEVCNEAEIHGVFAKNGRPNRIGNDLLSIFLEWQQTTQKEQ